MTDQPMRRIAKRPSLSGDTEHAVAADRNRQINAMQSPAPPQRRRNPLSAKTIVGRSALFAAVTGLSSAGLLAVHGVAQADPMLPLAPPACVQYGFTGNVVIKTSAGTKDVFDSTGADANGGANFIMNDLRLDGKVSGHVTGRHVDLTFSNSDGSAPQNYVGDVGDDGIARGTFPMNWATERPLGCMQQGPAEQPQPQAQAELPKQGPRVEPKPGLLGVTFHIADRSGVASQCTYSSEGFTSDGFSLPANGSFDLFVPAVREFRNRTGTVTCDNGTSANTSVQF